MSNVCLTLLCPVAHREHLIDLLLLNPEVQVFTSTNVAVHGLPHQGLSASEQVLGQATAVQITALVSEENSTRVIANLKQELPGIGLRYWLSPVTETGEIL